jgi:ketosteroid isomerase-like protein
MPTSDWWNRLFAAIDSKDTQGFLGFITEDGEFRFGSAPGVHGHAAIGAAVGGFFGLIAASRHRMIRTWEDAESAVCEGEVTYTRLDGRQVTLPFTNVFYLRDGKVGRYLIYIDQSPLFE